MQRYSFKIVSILIIIIFSSEMVYAMQGTRWRRPLSQRRRVATEIEPSSEMELDKPDEVRSPSPSFWKSNSDSEKETEKEPENKEEILPQPARILSSLIELMQPKTVILNQDPLIEEVLMPMKCPYADCTNCRQGFHAMQDMMRHIMAYHYETYARIPYKKLCTLPFIVSAEKF